MSERKTNMQEKIFKCSTTCLMGIIASISGEFTPLLYLLVIFEVMDYITGMYFAWTSKSISSKFAREGFFKKLFYFFLIAVAFGFDFMIAEVKNVLEIGLEYHAVFGTLSICYLLSTELISILENLQKIGISVPVLSKALKNYRAMIDKENSGKDNQDR